MKLRYNTLPIQGEVFELTASDVSGSARFTVFLSGEPIATAECDDPPCYESFHIPDHSAGKTLLIEVVDRRETQELLFFIGDDGRGVPMTRPKVSLGSPTVSL